MHRFVSHSYHSGQTEVHFVGILPKKWQSKMLDCPLDIVIFQTSDENSKDRRVKTICRKLLLLSPILWPIFCVNPAIAGVNCDGTPHTRLELAICGEPILQALDRELTAALKEVLQHGDISRQDIAEQRNQIARQCRREASRAFSACLVDAELTSLEWAANKLGQSNVSSGTVISKSWRYDESPAARTSQLQRQLKVAENRLRSTADPKLTVATILELISAYEQHPAPHRKAIDQLEHRLISGCDHVVYGAEWHRVLRDNNLSCNDLQAPALLSTSDF